MKKKKKTPYIGSEIKNSFKKERKNEEFMLEYRLERDRLDIARRVKMLREKNKITQEELAALVGTKQPSIARIESGGTWPRIDLLERIAFALGTNLDVRFSRGSRV